MLKYEISLEHFPGYIELPEVHDFNDLMFLDYKGILKELEKMKPGISHHRQMGYALADFVEKYGTWGIESPDIDTYGEWFDSPKKARTQLVSALSKIFRHYIGQVTDPFLSVPKSDAQSKTSED